MTFMYSMLNDFGREKYGDNKERAQFGIKQYSMLLFCWYNIINWYEKE